MENRIVDIGDKLEAEYDGVTFKILVVGHPTNEDDVAFKLTSPADYVPSNPKGLIEPGLYKTLSGAAETVCYPKQRNGWTFWKPVTAEAPKKARGKSPKTVAEVEPEEDLVEETEDLFVE